MKRLFYSLILGALLAARLAADSTVVFNEIMYHPLEREQELEWLELHNQMAVDVDISGWFLGEGVVFSFPEGTIVPGGGYLVVAISPESLESASGHAGALGPFTRRLSNSGEPLGLFDRNGRLMDRVDYGVGGRWPAGADGSGVSLAKIHPQSASAPAGNWTLSEQLGGTPGARNFREASRDDSAGDAVLAFNETRVGSDEESWVELVYHGEEPIQLEGFTLVSHGTVVAEFTFADLSLAPGSRHVLNETALGFELEAGNRLFVYPPSRDKLSAAVRLGENLRGRFPEATGRWLSPELPTPGAENRFAFHDDIIINEILYHQKSTPGRPAEFDFMPLLSVDSVWRYDATGRGQTDPAWRQPDYDDSSWSSGRALLYNESAELPGPKNTLLPLGFATYYFRAEFELSGDPNDIELALRPVVDDGAVFYLNGAEVWRMNMNDGEVAPDTLASRSVGNANFSAPVVVPGDSLVSGRNVLAVEVHQSRVSSSDIVFGLEVSRRTVRRPAQDFSESPEAWVELYNRGSTTVDLSGWRLASGIRYVFPPRTSLRPGDYLVVANDRGFLESRYPQVRVLGDFEGRLSHRGELVRLEDAVGNPVDEVRYYDDGRWPRYADAGGSSLELRNPSADNSSAEAWAASDEAPKAEWEMYSHRLITQGDFGPTQYSELVVGLLDAGEMFIDDFRVIELPGGTARELVQNGDFEQGDRSWRLLGNHGHSQVIVDPDDPANHLLHLVATGPTEHMSNHVETTLAGGARVLTGREYEIRFRARWLAGSNQFHTRLYFNRIPTTTVLSVPEKTGTPGARNSVYEDNPGPTFHDLSHHPAVPAPGEAVTVRIRVEDPDGVKVCRLFRSVDGRPWAATVLKLSSDGFYEGTLAGQTARSVVHFYIEPEDKRGARSTFPPGGRESRALYRVDDGLARLENGHRVRLILTRGDLELLRTPTNVTSNDAVGCTLVYDDREVFYDVGVRLKGSAAGRSSDVRRGFNVRFDRDHLFRGVHHSLHIDRPVGPKKFGRTIRLDEILFKHIANHVGGVPSMYDDIAYFVGPWDAVSGTALLSMARFTKVFLDSRYEDGGDGTVWKYELIYYPTTTTDGPEDIKRPVPYNIIGVDLEDLGDDKEAYRWNWLIRNNRDRDDYSQLIRCCKAFGLSAAERDVATRELIDVDEWMRSFALVSLAGVWDIYTFGLEHNILFFQRPADGLLEVFPLDTDHVFFATTTSPLVGNRNLGSLIRRPANLRVFYYHVRDIVESSYNADYIARWISHYGELAEEDYGPILDYVRQRSTFALAQLPEPSPFAITTNDGEDFTAVDESRVTFEGTAGIDVRSIRLLHREDPLDLTFPSVTTWKADVPLAPGTNTLTFAALDGGDRLLESVTVQVTRTSSQGTYFVRGDLNLDGRVDIGDSVRILLHLLTGQPADCEDAGDVDDNEILDLADVVFELSFLFLRGAPPAAPFPEIGDDPGDDGPLGCERGLDPEMR